MDEVLRLDVDKALVIIRGRNILEVDKFDYSKHYEAKKLRPDKAAAHIPHWRSEASPTPAAPVPRTTPAPQKDTPAKKQKIITTSKKSILSKPKTAKKEE